MLVEDVQRYNEFNAIIEQARTQLELNTDQEICNFKTQEVCSKCTDQVTLHSEGNDLSTDQCSDYWAEPDLRKQLVVHSMRQQSDQSVEEPFRKSKLITNDTKHHVIPTRNQQSIFFWLNDSWPNELINDDMQHIEHSNTTKTTCLCCGITFELA